MQVSLTFAVVDPAKLRHAPQDGRVLINTGSSGLGSHLLGVFEDCPRLFAYTELLGLPIEEHRMELIRGSLLHVGLAHHYARLGCRQKGGVWVNGQHYTDPDQFYLWADAIEYAAAACENPQIAANVMTTVIEKIRKYITWAKTADLGMEVVAVEHPFAYNFSGVPYTMRLDMVVRSASGVYTWDHKGTASLVRAHALYSMGIQIAGIGAGGADAFGSRGVVINYIQWHHHKGPKEFVRLVPDPAPGIRTHLPMRIQQNWWTMLQYYQKWSPWYWPQRGACIDKWGKQCPALDLCQKGTAPDESNVGIPNPKLMDAIRNLLSDTPR